MKDLSGKVALVTGGGRGIGRTIATHLVRKGAKVALCDIDLPLAERAASEIGAKAYALDVRDPDAWTRVMTEIGRDLGPVDLLVNNAGIMTLGEFTAQSPANDRRQIEINVMGVIHGMRAVLPSMRLRGRGHIVNIASSAGKVGIPHAAVYAASKHAVVGLTEAVRAECDGTGIGFTCVMPSLVDTELIAGAGRLRFPPPATPEDVARATVRAIERDRFDVFVPGFAGLSAVLPAILPRSVTDRIGRWFRIDQMFAKVDERAREAYRQRVEAL